ncbi:hypothetical protein BGW80DRAFT_914296 [Lactifluus volemus]|nr:hypothetical protein BGW80DRAFT_914296 [Lactifluus volemus]
MVMKMYSYMAANDSLHYVSQQSAAILKQCCDVSSWWVGEDAKKRREVLGREADSDRSSTEAQVPNATALRRRIAKITGSTTALGDEKRKELEWELVISGPQRVRWPQNITYKNFEMYQLIPLLYELEFSRTQRIPIRV